MNLINSKVVLTINLEGSHKPWFVKNEDGKVHRVYNPELNRNSECVQRVNLSEDFVNHAISFAGRVSARMTFAFNNWKKMSQKERLECNLGELSIALGGNSFSYEIISE